MEAAKTEIGDRYQLANAIEKVDGYLYPRPHERNTEPAFVRAKAECLKHLMAQVTQIESLSFEQFKAARGVDA